MINRFGYLFTIYYRMIPFVTVVADVHLLNYRLRNKTHPCTSEDVCHTNKKSTYDRNSSGSDN